MDEATRDRWKQELSRLRTQLDGYRTLRVDVANTPDDAELDDHLSVRLAILAKERGIDQLPPDVRAYYATRLFESEYGSGGVDGFADWGKDVGQYVGPGYSYMGLDDAARAFEDLWHSPTIQGLIADSTVSLGSDEARRLDLLAQQVGTPDKERLRLARQHPESFSV